MFLLISLTVIITFSEFLQIDKNKHNPRNSMSQQHIVAAVNPMMVPIWLETNESCEITEFEHNNEGLERI